jgi:hypothetical protein
MWSFLIQYVINYVYLSDKMCGVRDGTVGWGTALKTGRSRVRFPMISLVFFVGIILLVAMALRSTQPLTEMSTKNISLGERRPVRKVGKLSTFMRLLSRNSGRLNLLVPQDLSSFSWQNVLPFRTAYPTNIGGHVRTRYKKGTKAHYYFETWEVWDFKLWTALTSVA